MPIYSSEPVKTNLAVEKLQQLAKLAHQAGNAEAGKALDFAAELVTKRLAQCTAEKTFRDELAMAALGGLVSRESSGSPEYAANRAYQLADAMLEAREV